MQLYNTEQNVSATPTMVNMGRRWTQIAICLAAVTQHKLVEQGTGTWFTF